MSAGIFDLNAVLERTGDVDVVTTDVDLSQTALRGEKPFTAPVRLTAAARNSAGVVTLDCAYEFPLCMPCDRCLVPVRREMRFSCTHTVVRGLSGEDNDEYLVVPDGKLDLDLVAADDVLPELPAKFLCRDDCKGLCPICGKDLNEGECDCSAHTPDPRWAALDNL